MARSLPLRSTRVHGVGQTAVVHLTVTENPVRHHNEQFKLDGYILWEARSHKALGGRWDRPKALEWFADLGDGEIARPFVRVASSLALLGRSLRLARVKRVGEADKRDGRTFPGREEYLDRCATLLDSRTPLALGIELVRRVLSDGEHRLVALLQGLDSASRRPIVHALAREHLVRPGDPREHESNAAASPHHFPFAPRGSTVSGQHSNLRYPRLNLVFF